MSPRRSSTVEAATPDRIAAAADHLEARQSGAEEPEGAWTDRVWLPSESERRPCCDGLEPDKLKDPQKLRSHCRTLLHVANRFDLDSRLLRAELRRRREGRETAREDTRGGEADLAVQRPRPARPARSAVGGAGGVAASAEARVLHAKLVRLVTDKRADLLALAEQASERFGELRRQLADGGQAVEVILAESGAGELAGDLQALIDDIHHLVITRDTICRVL